MSEEVRDDLKEMARWLTSDNPPQPFFEVGTYEDDSKVRLITKHLSLGMLVVGTPGSGKTVGTKRVVEELAKLTSMKHIVIFDVKGDWSQLLKSARPSTFEDYCDVRIYTFGTSSGYPATLDPFVKENFDLDDFVHVVVGTST